MAASVAEGGCMCSAIRYRISGQPTNSMVCHCRSCRRAARRTRGRLGDVSRGPVSAASRASVAVQVVQAGVPHLLLRLRHSFDVPA